MRRARTLEAALSSQQHVNRLAKETSPYLLQHQRNPVDWYAWGPAAFEAARSQDKPIFLSVGYSTCYWCHVMERQCFENEAIAAEMNKRFINIKVDREERPDVDQLYMTAVQVMTRHGGWPMSVFLLPDLRPFYGGTYFPPEDSHGRPGFVTLLRAIEDAYRNRRDDVTKSAAQLTGILQQLAEPAAPVNPIRIDAAFIDELIDRSTSDYDPVNGGFGSAPKFPRETLLELLLMRNRQSPDERRMKIIRHALDAMANGGIRDHLGGGFHRYSTDAKWLVPHFEIMLYDNAMLAWCFVEANRQTGEPRYATVARGVFDFVLGEMTSPQGAFYTAFDAEVDTQEGLSYLWTRDEIESTLKNGDGGRFCRVYGVDRGPNFADPHHGSGVPDKNILHLPDGPAEESDSAIVAMRQKLYKARRQRKQPLLDTKIITSWNALMIRALAHGAQVLNEPRYHAAATRAVEFLLQRHRGEDETLYRTSRDEVAKYDGYLDDYAFFAQALLALQHAAAAEVAEVMRRKFGAESGGFYFTGASAQDLIVRQMVGSDSPLPSGNGVAAMVMMELGEQRVARDAISTFAGQLEQQGEGMSAMVQAAVEIVARHGPIDVQAGKREAERPLSPQELADQVVQVSARWIEPMRLEVAARILRGFHIQPNRAAEGLIATELRAADGLHVESIEYPSAETYEGEVRFTIRFCTPPTTTARIVLRYQACDATSCLPPAAKHVEVELPHRG
jgi:uncharacterized protein YyaL (SSP411 family)